MHLLELVVHNTAITITVIKAQIRITKWHEAPCTSLKHKEASKKTSTKICRSRIESCVPPRFSGWRKNVAKCAKSRRLGKSDGWCPRSRKVHPRCPRGGRPFLEARALGGPRKRCRHFHWRSFETNARKKGDGHPVANSFSLRPDARQPHWQFHSQVAVYDCTLPKRCRIFLLAPLTARNFAKVKFTLRAVKT